MTSDDAFIGRLEDYLDRFDGETPLPEGVHAEVRAALPAIRQVSTRPKLLVRPGSLPGLSAAARFGLVAAGLAILIAVGTGLVIGNRDHGAATPGPPTAVPTPSAPAVFPIYAPSLRNAPTGPCVAAGSGSFCTPPGTYRLDGDVLLTAATIDAPRGWFEWDLGYGTDGLLVDSGADAPSGSGWGILFSSFGRISADPCDARAGFVPSVRTAAEVARAMQGWPGFQVSTPQPISIGGYDGLLVEITSTKNATSCPTAVVLDTPSGTAIDGYPMVTQSVTRPAQFRILEIGEQLLIIRTTDYPQQSPFEETQGVLPNPTRHANDQLALRAMVDSLRFAPSP